MPTSLLMGSVTRPHSRAVRNTIKVSVFTGIVDDANRALAVGTAAMVAAKHGADILILPGSSLGHKKANGAVIQELADKAGVSILAEVDNTFCFRPNKLPIGPFVQRFSTGAHATYRSVQAVTNDFITGERVLQIGGKRIGILLTHYS